MKRLLLILFPILFLGACNKQPDPVVEPKPLPFTFSDTLLCIDSLMQHDADSALQMLLSFRAERGTSFEFNNNFSPESLFYAMGHELIHVSQNIVTIGYPQETLLNPCFMEVKEFWASSWQSSIGDIVHFSPDYECLGLWSNHINPLNPNQTLNYTNMMNYTHFLWLNSIIHPIRP